MRDNFETCCWLLCGNDAGSMIYRRWLVIVKAEESFEIDRNMDHSLPLTRLAYPTEPFFAVITRSWFIRSIEKRLADNHNIPYTWTMCLKSINNELHETYNKCVKILAVMSSSAHHSCHLKIYIWEIKIRLPIKGSNSDIFAKLLNWVNHN